MPTGEHDQPEAVSGSLSDGWARRRERVAQHIEAVALRLFADRGYRSVTVADVSVAAGVSSRTTARYFRAKEDLLLALPRRNTREALAELHTASRHGVTVPELWTIWSELVRDNQSDVQLLGLWWQAASQVPEAVARVRGEQHQLVQAALTEVILIALGDGPDVVLRARVLAAALHGANRAVVGHWLENQHLDLAELFDSATASLSEHLGLLGDAPTTPGDMAHGSS